MSGSRPLDSIVQPRRHACDDGAFSRRITPLTLAPVAEAMLDQIGLASGDRAIDVACGLIGILDLLCQHVGHLGQVVGIDVQPKMIDMARQVTLERRLPVELVLGDAAGTGLPRSHFDLVHARLLLVNIEPVREVVEEMVALARPGGTVALQEVDIEYFVCDPPDPQWDRLRNTFCDAYTTHGRDITIGRRLERILRDVGLANFHVAPHVVKTVFRDAFHTTLPQLAQAARPLILESGAITGDQLDELIAEAHRHLQLPDSTTALALWQAWGTKPGK
jgi:ubiquinone/menaquinone biosynthesis C-methylase UbiE